MQRLTEFWHDHRKNLFLGFLASALAAFLLLINLVNITKGSSADEAHLSERSQDLSNLLAQPDFLPLKFLHWVSGWLPGNELFWTRFPSVLLAALTLGLIVYITKRWGGSRAAFFGFLVVTCSAWLLHVGRLGTVDIAFYLALPVLIVSHLLFYDKPSVSRLGAWLTLQALLLYVPGMIWLVLINAFWQRSEIIEAWEGAKSWLSNLLLALWPITLLAPLIYGLILNPRGNLLSLAGLPSYIPNVLDSLRRAGEVILFIGAGGETSKALWLNGLPILDVFLLAALATGIVFYARHWRAFRSRMLLILFVVSLILIALGGQVTISLLVPILYIVIPTGIAYALHLWFKVFPRNPIIRGLGIGLIGLAVSLSCLYNLRAYFIAWPHHEPTSAAFSRHNLPKSRL